MWGHQHKSLEIKQIKPKKGISSILTYQTNVTERKIYPPQKYQHVYVFDTVLFIINIC